MRDKCNIFSLDSSHPIPDSKGLPRDNGRKVSRPSRLEKRVRNLLRDRTTLIFLSRIRFERSSWPFDVVKIDGI